MIQYIRKKDIRCIFHEEFVVPKVAQSIAEQTGAKLLTFSTAHNLTKDEFEKGVTFLDIMKANQPDPVNPANTPLWCYARGTMTTIEISGTVKFRIAAGKTRLVKPSR